MSVAHNKAMIRREIEEIWDKGDMSIVSEIIASNYYYHSPLGIDIKGLDGYKQMFLDVRSTFPDFHMSIDSMIAEGDKIAAVFTMSGTFKGKFGMFEPTGNRFLIKSVYLYGFENGKVVGMEAFYDTLTYFQQLGIKPPG